MILDKFCQLSDNLDCMLQHPIHGMISIQPVVRYVRLCYRIYNMIWYQTVSSDTTNCMVQHLYHDMISNSAVNDQTLQTMWYSTHIMIWYQTVSSMIRHYKLYGTAPVPWYDIKQYCQWSDTLNCVVQHPYHDMISDSTVNDQTF